MRIGVLSARGRLEYRTRDERPLTLALPKSPAAVRIYGPDGCCAALCLDLDASRVDAAAVEADAARLTGWLTARGARVITDRSPSGGVHLYVPMRQRVPYETAREIVEALAASHPTLDTGPHRSLKTGCIRPPGSAHKFGGHQALTMSLSAAYDILRRPNPPGVLAAIHTDLRTEIAAWHASLTPEDQDGAAGEEVAAARPDVDVVGARRALGARVRHVAETGQWQGYGYASASEARQAVITAAVAARWELADVAVRVADGRWPGLAALYAKYAPTRRHTSLANDWAKARTFLAAQRPASTTGESPAGRSHTSPSESLAGGSPGGETPDDHDHIRTWRTLLRAVEVHRLPGRRHHLARFILRALGEAAHKSGTRYVAFGTRSLAVATGTEYSSVAAVLRRLAEEPGGWIDLIEPARGEHADLYALTIPTDLAAMAADLRWDRGHAHALRPAFRELGHAAAFVFEAVEAGRATTITTLVPATGLHRDTVRAAVEALSAHGLLERGPDGLTAHPGRLRVVAELLGTLDVVSAQLRRYARDRQVWRAYLARHEPEHTDHSPDDAEDYWWPPDDATDETWTLTSTLRRVA
jgi:hypothetical protein